MKDRKRSSCKQNAERLTVKLKWTWWRTERIGKCTYLCHSSQWPTEKVEAPWYKVCGFETDTMERTRTRKNVWQSSQERAQVSLHQEVVSLQKQHYLSAQSMSHIFYLSWPCIFSKVWCAILTLVIYVSFLCVMHFLGRYKQTLQHPMQGNTYRPNKWFQLKPISEKTEVFTRMSIRDFL